MKKLLVIVACLMLMACAGKPVTLTFNGSVIDNPPDYMTYAGEGYGFAAIHPIGGVGGGP